MAELDRPWMAVQCVCFVCWISKTTDPHTECILLFHSNCSYLNAPQCGVLCALPVLFISEF